MQRVSQLMLSVHEILQFFFFRKGLKFLNQSDVLFTSEDSTAQSERELGKKEALQIVDQVIIFHKIQKEAFSLENPLYLWSEDSYCPF